MNYKQGITIIDLTLIGIWTFSLVVSIIGMFNYVPNEISMIFGFSMGMLIFSFYKLWYDRYIANLEEELNEVIEDNVDMTKETIEILDRVGKILDDLEEERKESITKKIIENNRLNRKIKEDKNERK